MQFLTSIFSFLSAPVTQLIKNSGEKAQATHQRKLKVITGEQTWDEIQAENSRDSWKDEYLTVLFTLPFILEGYAVLFDDDEMQSRLAIMYMNIGNIPPEYWAGLGVIVSASFGVRKFNSVLQTIRKDKKPNESK
jgi:hypothetical protein